MDIADTVARLTNLLESREPFVHVRFGDGDVMFIAARGSVVTGDGEKWTSLLQQRLLLAWLQTSHYHAGPLLIGDLNSYAVSDGVEREWDLLLTLFTWHRTRMAASAPIEFAHMEALRVGFGYARPFYEAIRDDPRDKVFVAPAPLGPTLAPLLDARWFAIPLHNAHEEAISIAQFFTVERPEVMLFAAGRGGKIMQAWLSEAAPGITQIDVGSGLDLLIDDGVRRGTDLTVDREAILNDYRKAGLCP